MQVSALFRHPIKSHGREALQKVELRADCSMPFDRLWAIAHDHSKADGTEWAPCANFSRGSKAPKLTAINATLDDATEQVTLTHPDRPTITLHPEKDAQKLLDWVMPLVPQERALPARILRLEERGFTDTPFASISLSNVASHHAVESLAMQPLSPHRWRSNIWFDDATPWVEFDWIGRDLRLGEAVLRIEERAVRCAATTANPETGERDFDTLRTLKILGHQDFGVYARVITTGTVAVGDKLELI
jgi:uncharacterized protein YcbX